jgi:hypothetical protein
VGERGPHFVESEAHARLDRSQGKIQARRYGTVRMVVEEGKFQQRRLVLRQRRDCLV